MRQFVITTIKLANMTEQIIILNYVVKESEVIIEELHDDDSFEYANMPPLVNFPSPIYLSHTQPPFIYQYVGDQVKILQVLGNDPSNTISNNQTDNNTDHWDQKEVTSEEASLSNTIDRDRENVPSVSTTTPLSNTIDRDNEIIPSVSTAEKEIIVVKESDVVSDIPVVSVHKDNNNDQTSTNNENIVEPAVTDVNNETIETAMKDVVSIAVNENENADNTSIDTTQYDNDSVESDDEASFGTPENSPKSKRKSPKGKYGKSKAPLPPAVVNADEVMQDDKDVSSKIEAPPVSDSVTSQESLVDIINKLPNTSIKESGFKSLQVVNPISENKKRHKSKSPARTPKSNSSGLGKLLQLPSKLAFWHKSDDKPKTDETSTSSDDHSRRSSTGDRAVDEFQSCGELNTLAADEAKVPNETIEVSQTENADDLVNFSDAVDVESEAISQDIIDKSDALQKLIDAKIESHPEYKFISLHEEMPTQAKSTDV